ncbi:uncharacterized protein LAESUDRAFT_25085 [Laetiporus sulphureus 93-53]|uniref:Uncharacterized protein n=1 Tax=Laetiporus sulphureus 93-53 TaxID=1314785 RepID=A0A165IFF1_9APHY|nr:uncharacterized protein LAESUDRAFT_25085 [Laetiporus sulphureus 93-53]KZT13000.1 hypothetical protein LAESUDRAFT_25085 [Laetiporus sulphureus 93-53]
MLLYNTAYNDLHSTFIELASKLKTSASSSANPSVTLQPPSSSLFTADNHPPKPSAGPHRPYEKKDFPKVKYWIRKSWTDRKINANRNVAHSVVNAVNNKYQDDKSSKESDSDDDNDEDDDDFGSDSDNDDTDKVVPESYQYLEDRKGKPTRQSRRRRCDHLHGQYGIDSRREGGLRQSLELWTQNHSRSTGMRWRNDLMSCASAIIIGRLRCLRR